MKGRIRSSKPELWKHWLLWHVSEVTSMPKLAFWYAGLWHWTDREGRFSWDAQRLKAEIAPFDNVNFERVLNTLANAGFIVKYRVGPRVYGWVPRWLNHQSINAREEASVLPPPPQNAEAHHVELTMSTDFGSLSESELTREPLCVVESVSSMSSNDLHEGSRVSHPSGTRHRSDRDADSILSNSSGSTELQPEGTATDNERARENRAVPVVSSGVPALPAVRGPRNAIAIRDRLGVVFDQIAAQQRTRVSGEQLLKLQAEMVFLYWSAKFSHPNAMLDAKRERKIIDRLKENDSNVSELLYALDGASHDDWIMGKDPKTNGKKYDDIVTVLRDRGQVERFASTRRGYRDSKPHKLLPELERALRGETTIKDGEP